MAVGGSGVGGIGLASYDIGAYQDTSVAVSDTPITEVVAATASSVSGFRVDVSESVAASASSVSGHVTTASLTESASASATAVSGTLTGASQTEVATASATAVSGFTSSASLTETVSASASAVSGFTSGASQTETASATSSSSSGVDVSFEEFSSASSSAVTGFNSSASLTESASASSSAISGTTTSTLLTEVVSASASAVTGFQATASLTEVVSASASAVSGQEVSASLTEVVSASSSAISGHSTGTLITNAASATATAGFTQTVAGLLGVNMSESEARDEALPFKDLMKLADYGFVGDDTGPVYDTGVDFLPGDGKTDNGGWPTDTSGLSATEFVRYEFAKDLANNYRSGTYHIFHDGTGTIGIDGDASGLTSVTAGEYTCSVTPSASGVTLKVYTSSAADPISNIRFVHTDDVSSYLTSPFNDDLIQAHDRVSGNAVRMTNWQRINGQEETTWADRPIKDGLQGTSKGVAIEYLVDYCNTQERDLWLNVPHKATDAYVTSLSDYVRDNLDTGLKCYVEYSNETWNDEHTQHDYCDAQAALDQARFQSGGWNADHGGHYFASARAVECFDLFYTSFGSGASTRLRRVISGDASDTSVATRMLSFESAAAKVDVLAIAPMFGARFGDADAQTVIDNNWSVATLNTNVSNDINDAAGVTRLQVQDHKTVATNNSVPTLNCYYAGQGLEPVGSYQFNSFLTNLFLDLNESSDMGTLYTDYFDMLVAEGVDVAVLSPVIGSWDPHANTLLRYYGDSAPKQDSVEAQRASESVDSGPQVAIGGQATASSNAVNGVGDNTNQSETASAASSAASGVDIQTTEVVSSTASTVSGVDLQITEAASSTATAVGDALVVNASEVTEVVTATAGASSGFEVRLSEVVSASASVLGEAVGVNSGEATEFAIASSSAASSVAVTTESQASGAGSAISSAQVELSEAVSAIASAFDGLDVELSEQVSAISSAFSDTDVTNLVADITEVVTATATATSTAVVSDGVDSIEDFRRAMRVSAYQWAQANDVDFVFDNGVGHNPTTVDRTTLVWSWRPGDRDRLTTGDVWHRGSCRGTIMQPSLPAAGFSGNPVVARMQLAQSLVAHFRGQEHGDGYVLDESGLQTIPSAQPMSAIDVDIVWEYRERRRDLGYIGQMDGEGAVAAYNAWRSRWSDLTLNCTTYYDGVPPGLALELPAAVCSFSVSPGIPVSMHVTRHTGQISVGLHYELETGVQSAEQDADAIIAAFDSVSVGSVSFGVPQTTTVGRTAGGTWQVNVRLPFAFQEILTS